MSNTFLINRHSTFRQVLNWPDGDVGNADLTGYTVEIVDAYHVDGMQVSITDAANGEIQLLMSDEDTANLTSSQGRFRIKLTSPSGDGSSTNELQVRSQ